MEGGDEELLLFVELKKEVYESGQTVEDKWY